MDIDSPPPKRRRSSSDSDSSSSRRHSTSGDADKTRSRLSPNGITSKEYRDTQANGSRRSSVSSTSHQSRPSSRNGEPRRQWRTRDTDFSSHSRSHSRAYSEQSYSSQEGHYARRRSYSQSTTRSRSSESKMQQILSFTELGDSLEGHTRGISCVKFSPDGTMIASASADGTVNLWSTPTSTTPSTLLATLYGHLAGISTLAFSPDSRMLATGSDDKIIRLWSVPSGVPYSIPLVGHHNYIYSLAFSPKGNMLVSGSFDEAVFLWDVRSARVMRSLPAHSDPVSGVDFNRDGTLLVSCSSDGLIRIWDSMTGQCLRTLVHEDRRQVSSVRFSPNSQYIMAWTLDQRIRLWDYTAGKCVKTYQGHENKSFSLTGTICAYEAGGEEGFLISGSEDGSIWAWDVISKEIVWTSGKGAHQSTIFGVDVTRTKEGDLLMVSAGLDHKIKLWKGKVERGRRVPINVQTREQEISGINGHANGTRPDGTSSEGDDEEESDEDEEDDMGDTTRQRDQSEKANEAMAIDHDVPAANHTPITSSTMNGPTVQSKPSTPPATEEDHQMTDSEQPVNSTNADEPDGMDVEKQETNADKNKNEDKEENKLEDEDKPLEEDKHEDKDKPENEAKAEDPKKHEDDDEDEGAL